MPRGKGPILEACKRAGHKMTAVNTMNTKRGDRVCRRCHSDSSGRWYAKKKAAENNKGGG
jgi:hypothetical protein